MALSKLTSSASASTNISAFSTCARTSASSALATARRSRRSAAGSSLRANSDSGKKRRKNASIVGGSAFDGFILILQLRHDARIGKGRRVAERAALGDVAQQAAHDLARTRLRQVSREQYVVGTRQ